MSRAASRDSNSAGKSARDTRQYISQVNVRGLEIIRDNGHEADKEIQDRQGDTPLHRAVKCGKTEMAAFLLSRGANASAKGKEGLTPYQSARGDRMKRLFEAVSDL